jgi:dTDP-glucose pyrophosphorylase
MKEYIIEFSAKAVTALKQINSLENSISQTLFVVKDQTMIGTLTDGDIRRGLLNGLDTSSPIMSFMNTNFKSIYQNHTDLDEITKCRENNIKLLPILDKYDRIIDLIDLTKSLTKLPITAVLMAGGLGSRLSPLTDNTPKPMLLVGDKPILEHNIDRLIKFGIKEFIISVQYLKDQIIDYFGDGSQKGITINYIIEEKPLGTIGALSLIHEVSNYTILLMNSDILTDMDFEFMYRQHLKLGKKMTVLSIPYRIDIPYAVMETDDENVLNFKEKPSLNYYTNGGVYLLDADLVSEIPKNSFYNATDLMEKLLMKKELVHYSHKGFWLDIGKPKDYKQSQDLISKLKL